MYVFARVAGLRATATFVLVAGFIGAPATAAESTERQTAGATSPPTYGVTVLPDPQDTSFVGTGLNESGDVSGRADFPSRAFVFRDGVLTELPHLTAEPSIAHDINDVGQVVGASNARGDSCPIFGAPDCVARAVRWVNGSVENLGTLAEGGRSEATAINDLGHVTGTASVGDFSGGHAFVWTEATGMRDITPETTVRTATGINGSDQVVGWLTSSRAYRVTGMFLRISARATSPSASPSTSTTPVRWRER
jgi:probable HAF family extracellular repeat protein